MFKKQTRIIAIDNNQDHLTLLTKVFHNNGIGCLPILYDQLNPPESPFTNVRLAFFDINLRDSTNQSEIFNDLANALCDYIDINNGPFALVFWTQNENFTEEFINYVSERRPNTPSPYLIKCIDKDRFYPTPSASLEAELSQILSSPTLDLLLDFENNAKESASNVINGIYNLIPKSKEWGNYTEFDKNFDLIFSKIAISAVGYHHAVENPDRAVYEALAPTISSNLIDSSFGTKWKSLLSTLTSSSKAKQPNYPDNFEKSKLNSIFHIDLNLQSSKLTRGIIIEIDSDESTFNSNFGISYSEWFSTFLPGLDKPSREESKLIAVEISASCDFSQKKKRTYKFMLGVLTKEKAVELINKTRTPHNHLSLDCSFYISNENISLFFNLNYVFSVTEETDTRLGKPLFTLKKEIMDMIGNRYANHVSRIGITSF